MTHPEAGRPAEAPAAPAPEPVDVRERGANQALSTRRLFIQLQVFTGCADPGPLVSALDKWDPLESTCRHASLSIL